MKNFVCLARLGWLAVTWMPLAPAHASDVWSDPVGAPLRLGDCPTPASIPIAGTGGCLRISGGLSATVGTSFNQWTGVVAAPGRTPAAASFAEPIAQARLNVDARMPTELGPVRAYVSLRSRR